MPGLGTNAEDRATRLEPMPFVGRRSELEQLSNRLTSALAGHGSTVFLVGGPGSGKTRLARELAALAVARGAHVGTGECADSGITAPLAPIGGIISSLAGRADSDEIRADVGRRGDVLAEAFPEFAGSLHAVSIPNRVAPKEERYRLFDAVNAFLFAHAKRSPLLLIVDDLQWADEATGALLRHLNRFITDKPILVVITTTAIDPDQPATATQIAVPPLDPLTVRELLSSIGASDLADDIVEAGRGELLLTRELVLDAREGSSAIGLPSDLSEVLKRRIERLSARARELATRASVFARPFSPGILGTLTGLGNDEALEELLRRSIIYAVPGADRFIFSSSAMKRALYEAASPEERARLHRDVADVLRQRKQLSTLDHVAIAWHFLQSSTLPGSDPGIDHALVAADRAAAAGEHQLVVTATRTALDLAAPDDPRRPDIEGRLGIALAWALAPEEATRTILSATKAIEARDGEDAALTYLAQAASLVTSATGQETAVPLAAEGLRLAGSRRDWRWLTMLHLDSVRNVTDDEHPGIEVHPEHEDALRALAMVSTDPDDEDHVNVLKLLHENAIFLPSPARSQLIDDLELQTKATRSDPALANAYFGLWSRVLHLKGDFAQIVREVPPAIERYTHNGQHLATSITYIYLARANLALGNIAEARAAMKTATDIAAQLPVNQTSIFTSNALNVLAFEDELRMYTDEGWTWLLGLFGIEPDTPQPSEIIYSTIKGTTLWINGAPFLAAMARIFSRLGQAASAAGFIPYVLPALEQGYGWTNNYVRMACDATEALWFADRANHIALLEEALREKIVKPDFRYPLHDGRLSLARICALTKRYDEAHMWFESSREVLHEQGARPMLAVCDFDEAWMHIRRGDETPAEPLLERAIERFTELEMTGWVRRARALGKRRGTRRSGPLEAI
jgi:tetratricopeptide (TPR) repeat protein